MTLPIGSIRAVSTTDGTLKLEVLAVPYYGPHRGRDAYGEFFSPNTDLMIAEGNAYPVVHYHGLEEGDHIEVIGKTTGKIERKDDGVWMEVILDGAKELARRMWQAAKEGFAYASSGAISHLVRINEQTGEILVWPFGELSLMDLRDGHTPANAYAVALPAAKAHFEEIGAECPVFDPDPESLEGGTPAAAVSGDGDHRISLPAIKREDPIMLTELLKQIAAMIAEALAAEGEATPDAETAADAMMAMEEEALSVVGDEEDEAKIKAILDENFQRLADAYLKAAHEAQQQKQQKAREAVKSFRANTPAPAKSDRVGALSRQAPALKRASAGYGNDGRDDFLYYIRTGDIRGVDPSLRANVNPLESVTNAQGAVTVPDDFLPEIIAKRDELSIPRLAGARVIQTSLDVVNVPIEDTSNTYFVITAQEGAADEDEPAFDQKAITVYRFTKLMKLSVEIVADNKANLEGFLTESAGRAWALTENKYTLTGTGSSQPQGIFVGGTAGLTFDSATAIAAAEIPELLYKINPAYMTGGAWTASGATIGNIRGLGTSTNRWYAPTPYGVPAAYNGALGDIEGYPAFASAEVSAIGAGNKSLAFGNWAFYGLVERQELTVQRLVELYAGNGQIGLLWSVRMGGSVLQSEAFQYGTHPTA